MIIRNYCACNTCIYIYINIKRETGRDFNQTANDADPRLPLYFTSLPSQLLLILLLDLRDFQRLFHAFLVQHGIEALLGEGDEIFQRLDLRHLWTRMVWVPNKNWRSPAIPKKLKSLEIDMKDIHGVFFLDSSTHKWIILGKLECGGIRLGSRLQTN